MEWRTMKRVGVLSDSSNILFLGDGMEMGNEDEIARRVAVSKEETNGSTSRASSKAEDVG